jgi:dihydroorotate dehydrogenase
MSSTSLWRRPWLALPPQLAHDLAPAALEVLTWGRAVATLRVRPTTFRGLDFANPLGLAGGADKNGESVEAWWKLGLGFIEVGTVTPEPQGPNDGKIIDRKSELGALWNRMGFPNRGARALRTRLLDLPRPRPTPILVNLGKNRTTPLTETLTDLTRAAELVGDVADLWVINISSPNTAGLRDLFSDQHLRPLLTGFNSRVRATPALDRPWLLKLSPDLEDVDRVVQTAIQAGADGFISCNTTLQRPLLGNGSPVWSLPAEGGLSGEPLRELAERQLREVVRACAEARERVLIISAGGVSGAQDIRTRLEIGADLVQAYSALVLQGPFAARTWLSEL